MKRSLLSVLMVAFLIVSVSGCAPKPVALDAPAKEVREAEFTLKIDEAPRPADAQMTNVAAAAEGKLTPAEALKLMLVQLLVAR
jgi:hypothetical protein